MSMLLLSLLVAPDTMAQDSASSVRPPKGDLPPALKRTTRLLGRTFSGPVHLVVDGVASGGGIAGGVGVNVPTRAPWQTRLKGLYSVREYWVLEGFARYEGRRASAEAYGRARDMPQVAFYGLGNESDVNDRSNFAMREDIAGVHASYRVAPWLTMRGRAEQAWTDVGPGRATGRPSIEQLFTDSVAPGQRTASRFGRYESAVELTVPASVGESIFQGLRTRTSYARWVDHARDQYSFSRIEVEAQQRLAVGIPRHRLTLHGWLSTTTADDGHHVPFYLQRTLGGRGQLRTVHEEFLGTDGSSGSLRGYDTFRFRGAHLVLLQAEYRIPIWTIFDATVFYDAGKATSKRADLDLAQLRRNYGVSASIMRGISTAARIDVGISDEGVRWLVSVSAR
jgi:hypothetical protein